MSTSKFKLTVDFIANTLCAVTLGAGIAEYSIDVFLTDKKVKYFKEAFKNNSPVSLNKSLRKQFDDVIQDLKHTNFQKAFSTPFVAEGINTVNVGCLNTRSGCYIGIPSIYNLNTIDDTTKFVNSELQEYIQLLNDKTESGQMFMESLIFSESAKKYSIARELILTDNFQIFLKSVSLPLTSIPMYALGYILLSSLPAKPFKIRALAFVLLCNVGIFIWLLARTAIENYYQYDADKNVCNISAEYILGGIEYYEKLIKRNLALRNIIPDKNIYSEQGNKLGLISVLSELPLTYRKKYLETRLKTLRSIESEDVDV